MFRFIKKCFFIGSLFLSNLVSTTSLNGVPLTCISMNNQTCKARPEIVNVNGNNPVFYPFIIKTSNVMVIVIILMILLRNMCSWCCKRFKRQSIQSNVKN